MYAADWLRILLLLLTLASFLPQLRLLWIRRSSAGLSLTYVLLNLIVATELVVVDLALLVRFAAVEEKTVHLGAWLTFAHYTLVCTLWLVIFVACVFFSLREGSRTVPVVLCTIYAAYLCISLVPTIVSLSEVPDDPSRHTMFDILFVAFHLWLLVPTVPIFTIAALYAQARVIFGQQQGSGAGALSRVSLAAQSVLSIVVGSVWWWWIFWPSPAFSGNPSPAWYLESYAVFDSYVFAIAQAILLFESVRRNGGLGAAVAEERTGEREPLIGRPASDTEDQPVPA